MTVFDAAARPMWSAFQSAADTAAYTNEPARVSLTQTNPPNSITAARSAKLDFSRSDLADEDELNDILWLAIKGTPAPVHSGFSRGINRRRHPRVCTRRCERAGLLIAAYHFVGNLAGRECTTVNGAIHDRPAGACRSQTPPAGRVA